ncbi:hypothetical protein [Chitinophaga sp.]|uniref:hypothetical protein n=1 Tax=Chitinophaga sp. TaxID=1869181 RepID=UPI0031E20219
MILLRWLLSVKLSLSSIRSPCRYCSIRERLFSKKARELRIRQLVNGATFSLLMVQNFTRIELACSFLQSFVLPEATDFASALNISGFNIGIALGAWTGGIVVSSSMGLDYTPLAGAAFVAIALIFCTVYRKINPGI